jgi:hypothetical protein
MSWYMEPDDCLEVEETGLAREAYELLLQLDGSRIPTRLNELLTRVLNTDELWWLQNKFDQDNGDPRILESERRNLGPIWPAHARLVLRCAIFNDTRQVIELQEPKYETIVGAEDPTTASMLTEDPHITVPLNTMYGIQISPPKTPSTRLGMISKDVWIWIGVKAHKRDHLLPPRATECLQLVYAKVTEPFHTPSGVFMMRAVTMTLGKEPSYSLAEKISDLDDVVLLKRALLGERDFLDRKTPTFEQEIQNNVSREMREFIGGQWYLAETSLEDIFQDVM